MIRLILGLILAMGAMEAEALSSLITFGLLGLALMAWGARALAYSDTKGR